jgi:hypothetical protein
MTRIFIGSAVFLAASVAASAGQIEIGQYVGNSSSGATQGLTSSYISGAASCVGAIFQGNTCIAGNSASWAETNYNTSLFSSASNTTPPTTPSAYSGYSATSTTPGKQITTGPDPFAMINETNGASPGTRNDWFANQSDSIFTVPVGLSGVSDAYLMLNNYWGVAGQQDTDVYFTFGTTSTGGTLKTVEVELTNSGVAGSSPSGQIQSSTSCLSGGGGSALSICDQFAGGPTLASSHPTTLVNGITQPTGVTVVTNPLYSFAYNGISSVAMNYQGTSGNVQLDDLGFLFGSAYENLYLVSIGVQENFASGAPATPNASGSDTVLSAITVDTAPEPSTWMLLLGGIAAMGISRVRRRS